MRPREEAERRALHATLPPQPQRCLAQLLRHEREELGRGARPRARLVLVLGLEQHPASLGTLLQHLLGRPQQVLPRHPHLEVLQSCRGRPSAAAVAATAAAPRRAAAAAADGAGLPGGERVQCARDAEGRRVEPLLAHGEGQQEGAEVHEPLAPPRHGLGDEHERVLQLQRHALAQRAVDPRLLAQQPAGQLGASVRHDTGAAGLGSEERDGVAVDTVEQAQRTQHVVLIGRVRLLLCHSRRPPESVHSMGSWSAPMRFAWGVQW